MSSMMPWRGRPMKRNMFPVPLWRSDEHVCSNLGSKNFNGYSWKGSSHRSVKIATKKL